MNTGLLHSLLDGSASDAQYLGLFLIGAALIGALVWGLDEQKKHSRGRRS